MDIPTEINLGSGKSFDPSMLNIDVNPYWEPDVLVDLSAPFDFGRVFETRRFGPLTLESGRFSTITAVDVLEHVHDLVTLMTNCLRLLRLGGEFHIKVPYDLSLGAWQDPTHVRAFNENSWLYYTGWFWYLGWTDARFDVAKMWVDFHAVGRQLAEAGQPLDVIMRTPRAVDAMNVILRKRALSDAERVEVNEYLARPPRG